MPGSMVLNGLNALQSEISTKMFLQTTLNYETFGEECQAIPIINFFLRDKFYELVRPIISLGCHQIETLHLWSNYGQLADGSTRQRQLANV